VPNLEVGLEFYCSKLGHELIWRTSTSAGLSMPGTDAEIVLQTERPRMEVDLLVNSAPEAAQIFERAGGTVVVQPFDVAIGQALVVEDPWGNRLVLIDQSKGLLTTDAGGMVTGTDGGAR
jgi:predicted enzyme related to lactoylglutathione lyase